MSNRGLVTKLVHALTSGDSRTVMELIASDATYRGPAPGTVVGAVQLGSVMKALLDLAPLPWHALTILEDEGGTVSFRREIRVAAGISHAETIAATIGVHGGKISTWVERLEDLPDAHTTADFGANEADAATRIK